MTIVKLIDWRKSLGQCRLCGLVFNLPQKPGALIPCPRRGAFTYPPCGCTLAQLQLQRWAERLAGKRMTPRERGRTLADARVQQERRRKENGK